MFNNNLLYSVWVNFASPHSYISLCCSCVDIRKDEELDKSLHSKHIFLRYRPLKMLMILPQIISKRRVPLNSELEGEKGWKLGS